MDRERAIEELIVGCLDADDPERELERVCGHDASLLRAARPILQRLLTEHGELVRPRPERQAAETVPGYRIVDRLGIGGGGVVFRAEQLEPVRRTVALKVLKLGMDTEALLQRFALEQRALALMNHDNIARVFDVGATASGRPFFAMELVDGPPITTYCERHGLGVEARLRLCIAVCAGLQHAHHKGIVHRDLKPGNVLVAGGSGSLGVPKIIDFGLAWAQDDSLLARSRMTEQGAFLGTPAYMSPEQARGDRGAIDTRTDLYSLGVMVYELLAGELPFGVERLRCASPSEIERMLTTEEPPVPSQRARQRGAGEASTHHWRQLRGDLDWIVMKAIDKDPARRYASPHELAADLERYLAHEPVAAGPPSRSYRLRKFVRRNRLPVMAGTLVAMSMIAGIAVSTSLFFDARAESRRADAKVEEFDMLATIVQLREARQRALAFPVEPGERRDAIEAWLAQDARPLLAARDTLRTTVETLRQRALPWSAAEREHDRTTHADHEELQVLRQKLAAERYAQAVRDGEAEPRVVELTAADRERGAVELADEALALTGPNRKRFGREDRALALAELAARKAEAADATARRRTAIALAWAQSANGLDAAALATARQAEALASTAEERHFFGEAVARLDATAQQAASGGARRAVDSLEMRVAALAEHVGVRRSYSFAQRAEKFLHDALTQAVLDIDAFERTDYARAERALHWARQARELTVDRFAARWQAVREAIRQAPAYRAAAIDLQPIAGLVPIGANPATGLQEFYHLRSAWDPTADVDASELPIPEHGPDGSIDVDASTGIVLVLIPGGTFAIGAQSADPNAPNYDPQARFNELMLADQRVEPFFIARHELTQAQWRRLSAGELPSYYKVGQEDFLGGEITGAHPVENVTWQASVDLLRRHDLELPTEQQWEFACRAGTQTPWWTGADRESLRGVANLAAQAAARASAPWPAIRDWPEFDDGFAIHAAVDALPANPFGLHHVHGNVSEWCADPYRSTDDRPRGEAHVCRGGSYYLGSLHARSAFREEEVGSAYNHLGLRPARRLRR